MVWYVRALHIIPIRRFHINIVLNNKNINRQVKILRKLLGERKSGSKKQWYPNEISSETTFSSPQSFSKTLNKGKNVTRRVNVLNKLFMKHITDLMATGEMSEEFIGKGLEISKVNVSSDFQCINVYWIAKGDANDAVIDETLQRCSGHIRNELSQLRLMGQVPKIYFLKDKIYSNLAEVQVLLKNCDFGDNYQQQDPSIEVCNDLNVKKVEFDQNDNLGLIDNVPVMRHDVLGLDHKEIMTKILTKMKKSKQAWEIYDQQSINQENEQNSLKGTTLSKIQKQIEENKSKNVEFNKFLFRRKIKNTPDRKKYLNYNQHFLTNNLIDEEIKEGKDDGDFIEEDDVRKK